MTRVQHLCQTGAEVPSEPQKEIFFERRRQPPDEHLNVARQIEVRAWAFPNLLLGYFAIIKRSAPLSVANTTCDVWIVHAPSWETYAATIRAAIAEFDTQTAAFLGSTFLGSTP